MCPKCGPEIARASKLRYPEHAFYTTTEWKRARRAKLERSPTCECPGGCGSPRCCRGHSPAREVDHIVELRDGGDPFADSNLRSLCAPCHRGKTRRERARRRARGVA